MLREIQKKLRDKASMLRTGEPDFSDGIAAGSEEAASILEPACIREEKLEAVVKAARRVKHHRKTAPFSADAIEDIAAAWDSLDKALAALEE